MCNGVPNQFAPYTGCCCTVPCQLDTVDLPFPGIEQKINYCRSEVHSDGLSPLSCILHSTSNFEQFVVSFTCESLARLLYLQSFLLFSGNVADGFGFLISLLGLRHVL